MKLYRKLYSIHKWLGLTSGVFLLLLGLSGSLLVFKDELEDYIYEDINMVVVKKHPLAIDSIYRIITKKYTNLDGIAWINPKAKSDEAYFFRLYLNDTKLTTYDLGLIRINQYTGQIIRHGRSDDWRVDLLEWCFQFHFSFHQGMPGAAFAASMGIIMLLLLFTGVLVYRKFIWKVLTFQVKIKIKNWRTISSDLHRVVGVWALIFNAAIFFTGFWMNLFAFEAQTWKNEVSPTSQNTLVKVSLDRMYQEALKKMPDLVPNYVYLPTQPKKKFNVRGNIRGQNLLFAGGNSVNFNSETGAFINVQRFSEMGIGDKIEAVFFPIHVGNYGGIFLKIIYIIIGLTPGLLTITGFFLWWRKQ